MPAIRERVAADVTKLEDDIWTALTSARPGDALLPLLDPECVLHFPNSPMLAHDTDPTLKEILQDSKMFKRWMEYGIQDLRVVVIDLMAAVVCYRVQASRDGKTYRALCSTTWKQGSDGDWKVCCHAQTPSNY
jgi:ketosteroid isomerase-like protein